MATSIKPVRFFVVFAAFLLIAFLLIPGPHRDALIPFPGEGRRKHGSGSQQPLNPQPEVDLIHGIPALGLGCWKAPQSETTDAVGAALNFGYRHIDSAAIYGNEKQVGEALASSSVSRSDVWITSKLWNTNHAPSAVRPAIEKTLSDLGISQLDLYLIHWPVAFSSSGSTVDPTISILDTWTAMEDLVQANLTKYIGVSNFAKHDVELILKEAKIKPFAHEFETHPYLQQQEFVDWHKDQDIAVIAYSPLANTNPSYQSPGVPSILKDKALVEIAEKKNVTVAQIILRWGIERGTIVIPKSTHESRIVENLQSVEVELSSEDMEILAGLDKKLRLSNPSKAWGVELFSDLD